MKGSVSKTTRQLKIETSKVIPLATEVVEKKKTLLRGKTGSIELKPHIMTRDLKKFLENEGMTLEQEPVESRRGREEIAGVKVKVMPIAHTHYDNGVVIRVEEKNGTSYDNTNKVLSHLKDNGIDVARECTFLDEHTRERAYLFEAKSAGSQ
jgi:hypothetical protein